MRDRFIRLITDDERNMLYYIIDKNSRESGYRAKILLLLKDEGYTVPEIRKKSTQPTIMIAISESEYIILMRNVLMTASYPKYTYTNPL